MYRSFLYIKFCKMILIIFITSFAHVFAQSSENDPYCDYQSFLRFVAQRWSQNSTGCLKEVRDVWEEKMDRDLKVFNTSIAAIAALVASPLGAGAGYLAGDQMRQYILRLGPNEEAKASFTAGFVKCLTRDERFGPTVIDLSEHKFYDTTQPRLKPAWLAHATKLDTVCVRDFGIGSDAVRKCLMPTWMDTDTTKNADCDRVLHQLWLRCTK